MINASEREQVRLSLIRHLDAAAGRGLSVRLLRQNLVNEGTPATEGEVRAELEYLADPGKGFARRVDKAISPELQAYGITAAGRDWFAQNCGF